jgi:hypothetical protein
MQVMFEIVLCEGNAFNCSFHSKLKKTFTAEFWTA